MKRPNIHWSFFENGSLPEELGMQGLEILPYGVHEVEFTYSEYHDWETGYVDDFAFIYRNHKVLWSTDATNISCA